MPGAASVALETTETALRLRSVGHSLLGLQWCQRAPVRVGVQRGGDVVQLVPGDAAEAVFVLGVGTRKRANRERDFRGAFVQGKRSDRFLCLSWGTLDLEGRFAVFRRARIRFPENSEAELVRAVGTGATPVGEPGLTDAGRGPLCAAVRPPTIAWQVSSPAFA